jgi:hypothetical protein
LKKQNNIKKLELHKETLTSLEHVTGGSRIYNTVYYPPMPASRTDCPTVYA